ncbi:MAG TPA: 2-amino-4-hydroxy-6-hydroxymethyldihydropteridine diphosphokinase [Nitrolancea sp.]|nr:2-amino-4-hydroxy-6-hydroxymethyldihydropteridine diphosphokinase [Nitrolancea sp.]
MARVSLSLGSNLGNRAARLRQAVGDLRRLGEIVRVSSLYETVPVGYVDQPRFLNAVVLLETDLQPNELLTRTMAIEQSRGRQRSFANAPRTLDIDILFIDDLIIQSEALTVPHPRLQDRAFVLVPLAEITPNLRHPVLGESAQDLLLKLTGEQRREVRILRGPEWIGEAIDGQSLE